MRYLHLMLVGVILVAESRFLDPPSFDENLQWSSKVEDPEKYFGFPDEELDNLLADIADETGGEEDNASHWLNKLKSTVEDISKGRDRSPVTTTTESFRILQSPNSLKDLTDSVDQLDLNYPEDRDHDRHVKSRYNFSAMFPFVEEDLEASETNKKDEHSNELDSMLVQFQDQINRLQKYLGKHCRKQKTTSSPLRKIFGTDQDWFISSNLSEW